MQFHLECDLEMLAGWASDGVDALAELGRDPIELLEACEAVLDDVADVWRPFAERFAALALRGPDAIDGPPTATGPGVRHLPLLGA